jgi:hypothetical protein
MCIFRQKHVSIFATIAFYQSQFLECSVLFKISLKSNLRKPLTRQNTRESNNIVLTRTHKTQPHLSTAYFQCNTALIGHMHITVRLPPPPFFCTSQGQRCYRESTTVRGTYSKHYELDSNKQQTQPVTFKKKHN